VKKLKALEILKSSWQDSFYECDVIHVEKDYIKEAITELEALEQRIKELEKKDNIGFQALNCSQCQGGGCHVCGGSGLVFGKILYKYHTEDKICGNCNYSHKTVYDGVILCTIGAHISGRKALMQKDHFFCADFEPKA